MVLKADGVFEGGGVKGIGLVGAVEVTEAHGYQFENVVGTSAGAIVASLIAAGYKGTEIKAKLEALDYLKFKDAGRLARLPWVGYALSLLLKKGIFEGDYFYNWLRGLLAARNVHRFSDLICEDRKKDPRYKYKLQVVASDITRGKLLILPRDAVDFDIDPDELEVARAVRMSMSIPYFYKPVVAKGPKNQVSYVVDGGILSNFPVWLLDDGSPNPPWPTFGYKLVQPDDGKPANIIGPVTLFAAMFSTMMEAHDARFIADHDFVRTISIPTLGVRTTEFDLKRDRSNALYASGQAAAEKFFANWNFDTYKTNFREKPPVLSRHTKLMLHGSQ